MKKGSKDVGKDALKFIALFAVFSALAYGLLAFTFLASVFSEIAARTSLLALQALGVQATLSFENGVPHLLTQGQDAEINLVCAGLIEIAVLFGIIFASFEKSVLSRAKGFAVGLLVLLVFNPIRIALSLKYVDPLVHDVLFRITLVVVLVTYYSLWFYWRK